MGKIKKKQNEYVSFLETEKYVNQSDKALLFDSCKFTNQILIPPGNFFYLHPFKQRVWASEEIIFGISDIVKILTYLALKVFIPQMIVKRIDLSPLVPMARFLKSFIIYTLTMAASMMV